MKFEIANEKNNIYLRRKELDVRIDHIGEPTPMKAALQQLLAKQLNKAVEHIEIVNLFSDKGRALAKSRVYIWEDAKAQDLSKVVKKKAEAAAPAETKAPAAPAKPAEKPAAAVAEKK